MEAGGSVSGNIGLQAKPPSTASTAKSLLTDSDRHNSYNSDSVNLARLSEGSASRFHIDSRTHSHYSSESSALANNYWPKVDSDESDEASPSSSIEQIISKPKKHSSTRRFFRYIAKKLGTAAPRYGHLPNNDLENDRNEIQHRVILDIFEDEYHMAPVSNPRRVLDVGTGPGTWAIEYARLHPETTVIGIDIEPVRNSAPKPKNCTFVIMDAAKDWEFEQGFDFIHVRMLGDMQSMGQLVDSIHTNLNPGGWAEFTEWIAHIQSPNNSLDGGAFLKWNKLMRQGLRALGTSIFYPLAYKNILRTAGFVNVQELKYAAPTNACYPGKRLQRIGHLMSKNWLDVIEPLSTPVFGAMGWSQSKLDLLIDDVKKEIIDTKYHSYMTLLTVVCQKPIGDSAVSSKLSFSSPAVAA